MKFLVLLAVLVIAALLWQRGRRRSPRPHRTSNAHPAAHRMVVCSHCKLHLPASEAVAGAQGEYCSESHRRAHEG